jgi:hypothetical protein
MCRASNVDVVLLQEPVMTNGKVVRFEMCRQLHTGKIAEAAIIIINEELPTLSLEQYKTNNTVAARICSRDGSITVVSSYFRYSVATNTFLEQIRPIQRLALLKEPMSMVTRVYGTVGTLTTEAALLNN